MKLLTPVKRQRLEERVFGRADYLGRFVLLFVAAAALHYFLDPLAGYFVAGCAVPDLVRAIRREAALGALLADDRKRALLEEQTPAEDLRTMDG